MQFMNSRMKSWGLGKAGRILAEECQQRLGVTGERWKPMTPASVGRAVLAVHYFFFKSFC